MTSYNRFIDQYYIKEFPTAVDDTFISKLITYVNIGEPISITKLYLYDSASFVANIRNKKYFIKIFRPIKNCDAYRSEMLSLTSLYSKLDDRVIKIAKDHNDFPIYGKYNMFWFAFYEYQSDKKTKKSLSAEEKKQLCNFVSTIQSSKFTLPKKQYIYTVNNTILNILNYIMLSSNTKKKTSKYLKDTLQYILKKIDTSIIGDSKYLCHGDLKRDNIIWSDSPTILDWDTFFIGPKLLDYTRIFMPGPDNFDTKGFDHSDYQIIKNSQDIDTSFEETLYSFKVFEFIRYFRILSYNYRDYLLKGGTPNVKGDENPLFKLSEEENYENDLQSISEWSKNYLNYYLTS